MKGAAISPELLSRMNDGVKQFNQVMSTFADSVSAAVTQISAAMAELNKEKN